MKLGNTLLIKINQFNSNIEKISIISKEQVDSWLQISDSRNGKLTIKWKILIVLSLNIALKKIKN